MLIGLNRIKNRIRNKDGWFLRLLLKDIPELERIHAGHRKIPEQKSTTRGLSGMHSKLSFQRRGCRWVSIERARETDGKIFSLSPSHCAPRAFFFFLPSLPTVRHKEARWIDENSLYFHILHFFYCWLIWFYQRIVPRVSLRNKNGGGVLTPSQHIFLIP